MRHYSLTSIEVSTLTNRSEFPHVPTNPAVRKAVEDLVESLANISDDSLDALTAAARDTVPGADYASITLVHEDNRVETLAPTDPLIAVVDQLQAELKEGPCYDAATDDAIYVAEDLAHDERWPNYGPKAVAHGIASQMGIDLHHPGSQRLRSTSTPTTHGISSTPSRRRNCSGLTPRSCWAMQPQTTTSKCPQQPQDDRPSTRIVMERYSIDEDRAFQFLIRVSQDSNVKVREVAATSSPESTAET